MRDLALDMAWAALIAPRRPDALHQVVVEWEATLEEIRLAGDDLPDIQRARQEAKSGIGMTPDELRIYYGISPCLPVSPAPLLTE